MSAPAEVRRWYHDHKMPLVERDWDPRLENGETATPERTTDWYGNLAAEHRRTKPYVFNAATAWWFDRYSTQLWPPREDRDEVEMLEAFFAPYLAMLPYPKGNIIRQLFNDRLTYAEAGEGADITRQGAWLAVRRAVRALVRLIAEDDPSFIPPEDGRRRDYDAEEAAAWRVYTRYRQREVQA